MIVLVILAALGIISVGVIWCSSKIGSEGNWYAERKAELDPEKESKKCN
nr:hypothetical protein [uncultured Butyrivibrio sp.]